jgi:hypothetical protein
MNKNHYSFHERPILSVNSSIFFVSFPTISETIDASASLGLKAFEEKQDCPSELSQTMQPYKRPIN